MEINNATILVIEDDISLLRLTKYNLSKAGFKVLSAENGAAALTVLEDNLPDLILCDVMMPVMNGLDFRMKILKDEKWKKIPFVFLTAKTQATDIDRARELKVEEYIFKPFEPDNLVKRITQILKEAMV